jgi:hypothetical protein
MILVTTASVLLSMSTAAAQSTGFTYQGRLADDGSPATGNFDFQFKLFDTQTIGTGTQQGGTLTLTGVVVSNGIFTVQLDFGACPTCFNGASRFLEIGVKPSGGGVFTTLAPRQPLTSTPYAIKSLNAATADGLSVACVNCITSGQIQSVDGSAVSGTIPVESVPAGSANYIQNTTTQQAASNFNINGSGVLGGTLSANSVDATTQFKLGGSRVLSVAGVYNLFAGVDAGSSNTAGNYNSFFGRGAGQSNTEGTGNSFFGTLAGNLNTTGISNSFVGQMAGLSNTTGSYNSFLGQSAGRNNTGGSGNAFVGLEAGFSNTTGGENAFFGTFAGWSNTTGNYNTMVGRGANVGAGGLNNATAVGSNALVGCSNCLVLGSINGVNDATSDVNVGIGTTAPAFRLHIHNSGSAGLRVQTDTAGGSVASFGGLGDFSIDAAGVPGGRVRVLENGNVGIGTTSPRYKLHVDGGGAEAAVVGESTNGSGVYGFSESGGTGVYGYSDYGYAGYFSGKAAVTHTLAVGTLVLGGATPLCRNASNQLATCSSSLRYKTDLRPFSDGLEIINRLRPIAFTWKQGGMRDLGLAAEEIEKVEPLLVTRNDKGEVEGVKYDRLSALFINAFKEQQAQLRKQRVEIEGLRQQLRRLSRQQELLKRSLRKSSR